MSYIANTEPSATLTGTNFVVYTKKIGLVNDGSSWPLFTTENGLGRFCITDIYVHMDVSTPDWLQTEAWRISIGTNATSYNNIANETGPHSGGSNRWVSVPTLATDTVDGNGTTLNSNVTVYAKTLQMSTGATTNSGTVIVGGFYTGVNEGTR